MYCNIKSVDEARAATAEVFAAMGRAIAQALNLNQSVFDEEFMELSVGIFNRADDLESAAYDEKLQKLVPQGYGFIREIAHSTSEKTEKGVPIIWAQVSHRYFEGGASDVTIKINKDEPENMRWHFSYGSNRLKT